MQSLSCLTPLALDGGKSASLRTARPGRHATTRQAFDLFAFLSLTTLTTWLCTTRFVKAASRLFSALLEERVTLRQTVYYLYAQVMVLATLAPVPWPMGWRACWFVLFCLAVRETRRKEDATTKGKTE